jgi:hypothetical protein
MNTHCTLILWKVFIPVDKNLDENLGKLDLVDKNSLSPVLRLRKAFPDYLEDNHLHIVARPAAGEFAFFLSPTFLAPGHRAFSSLNYPHLISAISLAKIDANLSNASSVPHPFSEWIKIQIRSNAHDLPNSWF